MSAPSPELVAQLCALLRRLREDNADFLQRPGDAQCWYDRGYANGMLRALRELLGEPLPCGEALDDETELEAHRVMAWGRAYAHGEAMGERETHEITGNT